MVKSKPKVKRVYSDYDKRTVHVRCMQNKARRMVNNERKKQGLPKLRTTQHVDHKVPISRGGTNSLRNLQVLTAKQNMTKGASTNSSVNQAKT